MIRETGLEETMQQEERHHSRRKVARTERGTEDGGNQQQTESLPTEGRVSENILESEDQNSDINTEQKEQEILRPEEQEEIQSRWEKHFETFYNQNISERKYQTKVDRKVNQKLLNTADRIVDKELKDMYDKDGISLWDLNVIYNTSAVTLLETNGKLREIESMGKRHNKPRMAGTIRAAYRLT